MWCFHHGKVSICSNVKFIYFHSAFRIPRYRWHPHRGQDLLTYLVEGVGRHADSMGNRGTFEAPGIQWLSAGSGIEHAEGGGTPKGKSMHGFQIWVNVPSERKMDDPKYGIDGSDKIPKWVSAQGGVKVNVIAGPFRTAENADHHDDTCSEILVGPFRTIASVSIIDITMDPNERYTFSLPDEEFDNCMAYVYGPTGGGTLNGKEIEHGSIIRFDATSKNQRSISISSGLQGVRVLVFSGKRLNQQIAWHGPFVMTTNQEIRRTINEYRSGTFLRKRAPFDYKKKEDAPDNWNFEDGLSQCL